MEQKIRKRSFALLILPLLLIPLISFGYAHFTDTVVEKYKIHVIYPEVDIGSYKVLSKWDDCLIKKCLVDNTLTIQTKVFPGWYAWIGLVLHNSAYQPVTVQAPCYTVYDPNNVWQYFTHTELFYGPYEGGQFATTQPPVWTGLKWYQLPPKATPTSPPILLEYCHKLVLWIKLKFDPPACSTYSSDFGSKCYCYFKIKISITVDCIPELTESSSWTWTPPK